MLTQREHFDPLHDLARGVASVRATSRASVDHALEAAFAALRAADELTAVAVDVIARLAPHGEIERATGLPTTMALGLSAGRPRWEANALVEAAGAMRVMPATAAAFGRGVLSWAQVRAIVAAVKRVDASGRAQVDRVIAAEIERASEAEPEHLITSVEDEVARLRPDLEQRREDRAVERSFLSIQLRLDGGGTLYAEADAEPFATILEAIDVAAPRPADPDEMDAPSRARQRLDGLAAVCEAA